MYFIFNELLFFEKILLGILKMLRDSAMERFLTTPLEEREKLEQINNLSARLSSNEAVIAKLEKELNDAIAERDSEVSQIVYFFRQGHIATVYRLIVIPT